MKKRIVLVVLLGVVFFNSLIQAEKLSSSARVSLITVSPGEELYSIFGHSAFLIEDTTTNVFKMYNYGTFDFDDPAFYWNFAKGYLRYKLSIEDPRALLYYAKLENRAVYQQILNLSESQTQKIYDLLEKNALPENTYYDYDIFYDNCSSRLRDVLIKACDDSIKFDLSAGPTDQSFRELNEQYMVNRRYLDLGIDIITALPTDKRPTQYQQMYMPGFLMKVFETSTVVNNGKELKLVNNQKTILTNEVNTAPMPIYEQPWVAFLVLFLIVVFITFYQIKKNKNGYWLDFILFGLVSLIGLFVAFLWFYSNHGFTKQNFNLIWSFPIHLITLPLLVLKKKVKAIGSFYLLFFYVNFFLLAFWFYLPQGLNPNLIPIVMAITLRSIHIFYRTEKNKI